MNTDNFQWNDLLVAEFCEYAGMRIGKSQDIKQQVNLLMEDFKQSKTIPNKKYEILTMINNKIGVHPFDWQCKLSSDNCRIHSVKRLSDGEVFAIGDKVKVSYQDRYELKGIRTIASFEIKTGLVINHESGDSKLSEIKKVEDKKPILTTETIPINEVPCLSYNDVIRISELHGWTKEDTLLKLTPKQLIELVKQKI